MGHPTPTLAAVAAAFIALAPAGCASAPASSPGGDPGARPASGPSPAVMAEAARADSVRSHYTQDDVDFMRGMIHHHAQALTMSRMAASHGASEALRTLTSRIMNAQTDEIHLMQRWLRDRGEAAPEVAPDGTITMQGMAGHAGHAMNAQHQMAMPGMLTAEQLAKLDAARGPEWDRLFLTYMIQHHQGALTMADELFGAYGAGQGDAIFKIASDIVADQTTEIDRMQRMLESLVFSGNP